MMNNRELSSKNVSNTVGEHLCNVCGACYVACPKEAITFFETASGNVSPKINEKLCDGCGICLKVCAGRANGYKFNEILPQDPFAGECLGCWVGKSADSELYSGSQSGGIVSQLLIEMLDAGEVDACGVVRMRSGCQPRAEAFLARNRDDILQARTSKYCPVPLLTVLREARQKNLKIALVGLGCHMHGLQFLRKYNACIDSTVKMKIGLICERVLTNTAIDYLIKRAGLEGLASNIIFKDKARTGYPGDITVVGKANRIVHLPETERTGIKDFFTPARCRLCFDKMNVLSDITVGDPWGIDRNGGKEGESVVVARSEIGRNAIAKSAKRANIEIRPVSYKEVLKGQISKKRIHWAMYSKAWQETGFNLPGYYERVVREVDNSQLPIKRYRKNIVWSLRMENCNSRKSLLRKVAFVMKLSKAFRFLSFPIRKLFRTLKI